MMWVGVRRLISVTAEPALLRPRGAAKVYERAAAAASISPVPWGEVYAEVFCAAGSAWLSAAGNFSNNPQNCRRW